MSKLTKSQFDSLRETLRREGKLTTSGVLKMASDPASPLHNLFEWDDSKAAHQYRLDQARHTIKLMNLKIESPEDKIVHVPSINQEGEYKTAINVVGNVSDFELALTNALKRLKSSEIAVSDLHALATKESPDKAGILAIALKGLNTAESALNKLH